MHVLQNNQIVIYTDGSCNTQTRVGGWAAIILVDDKKTVLSGIVQDTTHNRMELTAVIEAIKYIIGHYIILKPIKVITDSQYVVELPNRGLKLALKNFLTNAGKEIQNADLVKAILDLYTLYSIEFIKIKAHLKQTDTINYNIEVDKISRKIVREIIKL